MIVVNPPGNGTYWRAFHFGRVLAARGHAVTLLTKVPHPGQRGRTYIQEGVEVVETPDWLPHKFRFGYDPWGSVYRVGWVQRRRFDLVHAFESRPSVLFPALVAQHRGAKLVMDWADWFGRGGIAEENPYLLGRLVYRVVETYFEDTFRTRADGTTVINTFLRDRALGLGVRPENMLLIRNGSDVRLPVLPRAIARQKYSLPPDVPLIGYAGSIMQNDIGLLVEALNRVLRVRPDARLVLLSYFKHSIESKLDNPAAVIRFDQVSHTQLNECLAGCDVCWLPLCDTGTNRGRWPFKLNVYIAAGRPVITTSVGDLESVVNRYHLGRAVPADAQRFAAQTLELLNDPALCDALGAAARQAAEQVFSWEQITVELERLYSKVMGVTAEQRRT